MVKLFLLAIVVVGLFAPEAWAQASTPSGDFGFDKVLRWLENASPFAAGLSIYLWLRSDAERRSIQVAKDAQTIQMLASIDKQAEAAELTNKLAEKAAVGVDVVIRAIEKHGLLVSPKER